MNPLFDQLQQQAAQDSTKAAQLQALGDNASLLARYGTRLSLATTTGGAGAPLMSAQFGKAA